MGDLIGLDWPIRAGLRYGEGSRGVLNPRETQAAVLLPDLPDDPVLHSAGAARGRTHPPPSLPLAYSRLAKHRRGQGGPVERRGPRDGGGGLSLPCIRPGCKACVAGVACGMKAEEPWAPVRVCNYPRHRMLGHSTKSNQRRPRRIHRPVIFFAWGRVMANGFWSPKWSRALQPRRQTWRPHDSRPLKATRRYTWTPNDCYHYHPRSAEDLSAVASRAAIDRGPLFPTLSPCTKASSPDSPPGPCRSVICSHDARPAPAV